MKIQDMNRTYHPMNPASTWLYQGSCEVQRILRTAFHIKYEDRDRGKEKSSIVSEPKNNFDGFLNNARISVFA